MVLRVPLVAVLVTVTVAPGTAAPDESVTVPVIPPCVCARPVTTHEREQNHYGEETCDRTRPVSHVFSKVTGEHGQRAAACAVNVGRRPRPNKVAYGTRRCHAPSLASFFERLGRRRGPRRNRYGTVDRDRVDPHSPWREPQMPSPGTPTASRGSTTRPCMRSSPGYWRVLISATASGARRCCGSWSRQRWPATRTR